MADQAISTAILTVATIIAALVLVNALYPSLYSTSGSILSMNNRAADRIRTDLTVLTEWYDPAHPANDIGLEAWVKNIGSTTVTTDDMANIDLFLYTGNHTAVRIPGASWSYELLNGDGDSDWDPSETIHVLVHYDPGSSSPGVWKLRMVLPDGVGAEDSFTYAG
jgi:archaeal flagellar protein FlaG